MGSLYVNFKEVMEHTIIVRVIDAVLMFIQRLFSGSILVRALRAPIREEKLRQSFFVRVVDNFFGLFTLWRDRFFRAMYENSTLYMLMESLSQLFLGSFAARLFCRLLHIDISPPAKQNWLGVITLGLLIVAACAGLFFFPPLTVAMGVCGIAGAVAVLAYPELGVLAVTAAAPFLPTMVLAAMLGYVMFCFLWKLLTDARYTPVVDLTGLILILYIIVGIFYGFTSFTPGSSLSIAALTTLLMLSYFVTVTLMNTKWKLDAMLFVFCTSAAVTGVYGLYQKLSGKVDMTWVDKQLFDDVRLRVYSTFANPNVYGTYLLLAIPVCLVMVYTARRWFMKLYYLAISLLLIYNLGYTYSRGCYLALAVGAFVFVLFMAKRLIALFFAGLAAVPFVLPPTMLSRIMSIFNMGAGDSSTQYRVDIWRGTLRILKDFWFAGLGQGILAYNSVYPFYAFNDVFAPHSHNLFLQIFVETGICGLLVFLGLLLSFFKTQIPFFYKMQSRKAKILSVAFMAAVLAFLFQGLFDYVFYNYRVLMLFFLFLGIGNALTRVHLEGDQP